MRQGWGGAVGVAFASTKNLATARLARPQTVSATVARWAHVIPSYVRLAWTMISAIARSTSASSSGELDSYASAPVVRLGWSMPVQLLMKAGCLRRGTWYILEGVVADVHDVAVQHTTIACPYKANPL
jgi:hypothetical protein